MEEMSSIVENNADEAKKASNIVRNARGTVDSSRESLLEAVGRTIETNERTLADLQTTNTGWSRQWLRSRKVPKRFLESLP